MSLGTLCLALYLIVVGVMQLTGIDFQNSRLVLGLLALVAGIAMVVAHDVIVWRRA